MLIARNLSEVLLRVSHMETEVSVVKGAECFRSYRLPWSLQTNCV